MVFSFSLNLFHQIFCWHGLFFCLLNCRLSSPILTTHCSLSFCMVSGACAVVSLQRRFSVHLCITVKRPGVPFSVKCFFSVRVIPIRALKKEDTLCPAQFSASEIQLYVCWCEGWACSIFVECFHRMGGALLPRLSFSNSSGRQGLVS